MPRSQIKPYIKVLDYFRTAPQAEAEIVLDQAKDIVKGRTQMQGQTLTQKATPAATVKAQAPVPKAKGKPGPKPGQKRHKKAQAHRATQRPAPTPAPEPAPEPFAPEPQFFDEGIEALEPVGADQ